MWADLAAVDCYGTFRNAQKRTVSFNISSMDHLPRCHMVKFPRGTSAPTGSNRVSLPNFPKTTWPHFIIHAPARHGRYSLSTHCVVFLKEKLQMCRNCIIVAYHYYTTKRFGDSTMSYDHCNFLINFSTTPVRMESDFTDIVLDIWRWSECFLKKGQTTDLPNRTLTLRFPLGIFPKKKSTRQRNNFTKYTVSNAC